MKTAELHVGNWTLRIAGVGEQRTNALEAHCRRGANGLDHIGNVRGHHTKPRCAAIDFYVNRKIGPSGRCGRAVQQPDHRGFENERRQVECNDLGGLFGEEARLQIYARGNARIAQFARLVECGNSEVTAAFIDQGARDRHGAMAVSVGLDHDHQLAV